jgi:hypothetical protein
MFRKFLLTAAVAVAATLIAPAVSRANMQVFDLTLTAGSETVTLDLTNSHGDTLIYVQSTNVAGIATGVALSTTSNGGLYLLTASQGGYQFTNGSTNAQVDNLIFDGLEFSATTAHTNQPGLSTVGDVDLTNSSVSGNTSGQTVSIAISENGFTSPGAGSPVFINSALTTIGTTGSTTGSSSDSDSATPVSETIAAGAAGSSTNISTLFASTGNYTITGLVTTTGNFSGIDLDSSVVLSPAPSGLILAATIVPFFGLLRRRLRSIATETTVVA